MITQELHNIYPLRLFEDSVSFYNTASVYKKTKRGYGVGCLRPPYPDFRMGVGAIYVSPLHHSKQKRLLKIFFKKYKKGFYIIHAPWGGGSPTPMHLLTASALSHLEYLGGGYL